MLQLTFTHIELRATSLIDPGQIEVSPTPFTPREQEAILRVLRKAVPMARGLDQIRTIAQQMPAYGQAAAIRAICDQALAGLQ